MKTYHLKWSSHIPNMETVFSTLFESEGLADVTVMCMNGSMKAHRLILSTCSNYFLRLFLDISTKRPVITLPEVTLSTMRNLLKFIYTGEVQVSEEKLAELLQAAEMLDIRGLTGGGKDDEEETDREEQERVDVVVPEKEMKREESFESCTDLMEIKENLPREIPFANTIGSTPKKSPLVSPNARGHTHSHNKVARAIPIPDISIIPIQETIRKDPAQSAHHINMTAAQAGDLEDGSPYPNNGSDGSSSTPTSPSPYPAATLSSSFGQPQQLSQSPSQSPLPNHTTHIQQDDINNLMAQVSFPTCPICAKDCDSFPTLRCHLLTHLQGSKPWACEFCDAKFSRASHLARHVRTHTGEKPFVCKKCGKNFSRQDKLKTHFDRHMPEDRGGGGLIGAGLVGGLNGHGGGGGGVRKRKALKGGGRNNSIDDALLLGPTMTAFSQGHVESSPRPWNNVAFPGFSSPFYPPHPSRTPPMQQQHHHHHHLDDAFAQRFNVAVNGGSIMSSLMKLGECSVQQVPK